MKKCPECGENISMLTVIALRASQEIEPTPCESCGLLLSNGWAGDLAPFAVVLLVVAIEILHDTSLFDLGSIPSILFLLLLILVVRLVFSSPRPYKGRKAWCPTCAREDAIHDWTDDPTCMKCEARLRPGMRVDDEGAA